MDAHALEQYEDQQCRTGGEVEQIQIVLGAGQKDDHDRHMVDLADHGVRASCRVSGEQVGERTAAHQTGGPDFHQVDALVAVEEKAEQPGDRLASDGAVQGDVGQQSARQQTRILSHDFRQTGVASQYVGEKKDDRTAEEEDLRRGMVYGVRMQPRGRRMVLNPFDSCHSHQIELPGRFWLADALSSSSSCQRRWTESSGHFARSQSRRPGR